MKKLILNILGIILLVTLVTNPGFTTFIAFASQSSSSSATIIPSSITSQIDNLKDRIASRVAQLKLVDKRGIIGTVVSSANNEITMTDLLGNQRMVDVDELTKFTSDASKTFGISDMVKGLHISVVGLYNKESKKILARFISTDTEPKVISGIVRNIDKKNFNVYVDSVDQTNIMVDIESTSKILYYSTSAGLSRVGFSKITTGERVEAIGNFDAKDKTKFLTTRLLLLPSLVVNPRLSNATSPSASASATPSISPKGR